MPTRRSFYHESSISTPDINPKPLSTYTQLRSIELIMNQRQSLEHKGLRLEVMSMYESQMHNQTAKALYEKAHRDAIMSLYESITNNGN
jgi:hypothetical protein